MKRLLIYFVVTACVLSGGEFSTASAQSEPLGAVGSKQTFSTFEECWSAWDSFRQESKKQGVLPTYWASPLDPASSELIGMRWSFVQDASYKAYSNFEQAHITAHFEILRSYRGPFCVLAVTGQAQINLKYKFQIEGVRCRLEGNAGSRSITLDVEGWAMKDSLFYELDITPERAYTTWISYCNGRDEHVVDHDLVLRNFGYYRYRDTVILQDPPGGRPFRSEEWRIRSELRGECTRDAQPAVPITVAPLPRPEYSNALSIAEIRDKKSEPDKPGQVTIGLTRPGAATVEVSTEGLSPRFGTRTCLRVTSVTVVPVKGVSVWIPSEYAPGTCNYEADRRHEDRHVEITRHLVQWFTPKFVSAISDMNLPNNGTPRAVTDPGASEAQITAEVLAVVTAVRKDFEAKLKAEYDELDVIDGPKTLAECPPDSW